MTATDQNIKTMAFTLGGNMNELIQQIKQQAIDYVDSVDDGLGIEEYRELVDLKFAELIVGECITVARGADGLDATHEAWYLIKQHFGVEE
jgi:hypothetical protein